MEDWVRDQIHFRRLKLSFGRHINAEAFKCYRWIGKYVPPLGPLLAKALFISAILLLLAGFPLSAYASTVILDPGHGGWDPGAVSLNGVQEKKVALSIAEKVREDLLGKGYRVYLTRTSDKYVTLQHRLDFADVRNGDIFVSIHANWYDNPQAAGSLVLYFDNQDPSAEYPASRAMRNLTPQSKLLAQEVLQHVLTAAGTQNQGLIPSHVYVVRNGDMPSILVETAFLSNPDEARELADSRFQEKMAQGIAGGIESYLPVTFSDISGNWAQSEILDLKDRGLVSGYNGRFHPNRPVTRAEFTSLLLSLSDRLPRPARLPAGSSSGKAGSPSSGGTTDTVSSSSGIPGAPSTAPAAADAGSTVTNSTYGSRPNGSASSKANTPLTAHLQVASPASFSDVAPADWDYGVVMEAARLQLVNGYKDGTFRPNQPITREEAVVMLERLIRRSGRSAARAASSGGGRDASVRNQNQASAPSPKLPFSDVQSSRWSEPDIYAAWRDGMAQGAEAGSFEPGRSITRAESAVMADRLLNNFTAFGQN